jgi:hypothetical protein
MNIQLLKGHFSSAEAAELITQMIHVKVRFHESKISNDASEEDVKCRETRIKELQRDLFEFKKQIDRKGGDFELYSQIEVSPVSVNA